MMSVYFGTMATVAMQVRQSTDQKVSPGGETPGVLQLPIWVQQQTLMMWTRNVQE